MLLTPYREIWEITLLWKLLGNWTFTFFPQITNSTDYFESFVNDSQIEGENLRFCQGIPPGVLRLRWTQRMFIRCLTTQCEEIYWLFSYFCTERGNSYISPLLTLMTLRYSHQTQGGSACFRFHLHLPWLAPVAGGCNTTVQRGYNSFSQQHFVVKIISHL